MIYAFQISTMIQRHPETKQSSKEINRTQEQLSTQMHYSGLLAPGQSFAVVRSHRTFYRIFHSKWDYWKRAVVDMKCLENMTEPERHSKLPWPEEITAERRRQKMKHCFRIAETYINTWRSMKSMQEHQTISWFFFVKQRVACKLYTILDWIVRW